MHVVVLPQDPVVFLVHADRVLHGVRLAFLGREDGVEVVDDAEAVAAELERVRHASEAPLAGVERVLPPVHRAGVAVRHDHLRDRRTRQHPTEPIAVAVVDVVQRQAFVGVEADAERPALPLDAISVDREARSLGLCDLERLEVIAHRSDIFGKVRAALGRQRHDAVIDDLEHLVRAPPS